MSSTDHYQLLRTQDVNVNPTHLAIGGFLARYHGATRRNYQSDLRCFLAWCQHVQIKPLDLTRPQLELWVRHMEEHQHLAPATVARRLSTAAGLFRFAHIDGIIDNNPAEYVRRPTVPDESNRNGLDRMEMGAFIHRAQASGPMDHALACLLGLLGLRVGEATGLNIEDLHEIDGHRTIHLIGKGNKPAVVPMPPRVARACDLAANNREIGPLLLSKSGRRMNRHAATRIVQRVAKAAGITKHLSPHSLRHAFITNALDAGVPLRDVQIAARHADPRTTTRYDRNRNQLDRHASYIVTAYIAGAT